MSDITLLHGDCLELMRDIPDGSVDAVITSPPYYRKLDYGLGSDQLGLETTPRIYAKRLTAVFSACRPKLVEGATVWVVISDTYNNSSPVRRNLSERKDPATVPYHLRKASLVTGYREKEIYGVPFLFAEEMRQAGFVWRSTNIWHKPHAGYDSATDRPSVSHEYVLQFINAKGRGRPYGNSKRIDGSVWTIPTESYQGHPCPFPVGLVVKLLDALPVRATVLDPFMGSGATGEGCIETNRAFIGIEKGFDYFAIAEKRIQDAQNKARQMTMLEEVA